MRGIKTAVVGTFIALIVLSSIFANTGHLGVADKVAQLSYLTLIVSLVISIHERLQR